MTAIQSVLIVDDNPFDVLLTTKMLEKSGHFENIYAATDGAEAIALFHNYESTREKYQDAFPPLLILLDINMPLMNGFEFLDEFNKLDPATQQPTSVIVMLTSSSHDRDRDRALEYPAVKGYLVKPMNRQRADELAAQMAREFAAPA